MMENGINAGDRVKLLPFSDGGFDWCPMLDRFGEIVTVSDVDNTGIMFDEGEFGWPWHAVEKVS